MNEDSDIHKGVQQRSLEVSVILMYLPELLPLPFFSIFFFFIFCCYVAEITKHVASNDHASSQCPSKLGKGYKYLDYNTNLKV